MSARRLAAIDIGTVTTRLLVADVTAESITEVERSTDITHLGEDLTATGRLSGAAIDRVAAVIARYAATMRDLGVVRFFAVATSASRDAVNAGELLGRLEAAGVRPLVIEGSREAYLSFLGATFGLDAEDVLVDDIGGGSTELVFGSALTDEGVREVDVQTARSIDIGSRRLTEMFLTSDPPAPSELARAREFAAAQLRPYFEGLREKPEVLVSVAGTATSLASMALGLAEYDSSAVHGYVLSGHEVSDLLESLAAIPLAKRREVVGLHPERASVIVAGTLVLETVLALAGLDSTIVSERDILYGILLDAYADGAA